MARFAMTINFIVYGEAKPAGSKRVFTNRKTGKPIVTDSSGKAGRNWRADVQTAARMAHDGPLLDGPLAVEVTFYRARPKGHYGTGRNAETLKPSAPEYPTTRPDLLKVMRAVEDALNGVLWRDDSQVVDHAMFKRFAHDGRPRVEVEITSL